VRRRRHRGADDPGGGRDDGFALAGGNALVVHGIISRPTEDVDLFADAPGAVGAAAGLVASALAEAGLTVTPVAETGGLGDVFYGFDQEMVEYEVSGGGHVVRLQLVRFDRSRPAVSGWMCWTTRCLPASTGSALSRSRASARPSPAGREPQADSFDGEAGA
jgi:hypothetical protein